MIIINCDMEKLREMYNKYSKYLYGIAYKILSDSQMAEDAVQVAFERLMNYDFKIVDVHCNKTRNYLVTVVKNVCRSMFEKTHVKHEKISNETDEQDYWASIEDKSIIDFASMMESKENESALMDAINSLPEVYREVFDLKYIHELSNKDIALHLNISEGNIRLRLFRAKKILVNKLTVQQFNAATTDVHDFDTKREK